MLTTALLPRITRHGKKGTWAYVLSKEIWQNEHRKPGFESILKCILPQQRVEKKEKEGSDKSLKIPYEAL